MAFLANLALFFVFFLPLTLGIGLPFDFYLGRFQSAQESVPVIYWILLGWPLFVPSVLFVPLAHLLLAVARRVGWDPEPDRLRRLAVAVFPAGFLAVHLLVWGTVVASVPLLVSFGIPGLLFGWVARIPRRARSRELAASASPLPGA